MFHLITAAVGNLPPLYQRPIHVAFAVILTFALVSAKKGEAEPRTKIPLWDLILIIIMLASSVYIIASFTRLMFWPFAQSIWEPVLGLGTILVVIEAARRRVGAIFPSLVIIAAAYALWGHLIPGPWGHAQMRPLMIIESLYLSDVGVWGLITGVSATLVAMFIIFGAFLLFTGGGQTFIDMAVILSGRMWGGGAKVATVASAFFGMISGSAVANSAATGNFTIPLMKKLGYEPEYAAAVEATASTGGIFTPPVMGATAFILAEMTGFPYVDVMIAATIPAFLFYFSVFFSIDAYARKKHLPPVPPELIPPVRSIFTWTRLAPVIIPVIALVGLLLNGFSPFFAAFWSCATAVIVYVFSVTSFTMLKTNIRKTIDGLDVAGKSLASIVPLLVCASIVVGLIQLTGIGVKVSDLIVNLGGTHVLLALVLGAFVAIILGMGMPVNAAYVLCAAVVAPGLVKMGLPLMATHLFVMYFACISGITPPVCPNVFVTSAIANSDWVKTGWRAMRLAFIIYVIPFIFIFDNALLMEGTPVAILASLAAALWATFIIILGIEGFFLMKISVVLRVLFLVSGGLLLMPQAQLTQVGLGLSALPALVLIWQWRKTRKSGANLSAQTG